jgi:cellulose synthase operon protein YhjQ
MQQQPVFGSETPLYPDRSPGMMGRALLRATTGELQAAESTEPSDAPWLLASASRGANHALSLARHEDTLQDSRERMAARWYALKGVFDPALPALPALPLLMPESLGMVRTPLLLVFSLAGGVGKTSLAATLGRALSARGERVLLADTTSHGLLPFYFGARELRDGVVRTFSAPEGSSDSPIDLVSYNLAGTGDDEPRQAALTERILGNAQGGNRLVLDLAQGTSWMVRRLAKLRPTVLVPLTPEMNSVISLQSVERLFHGVVDEDGFPLLPFYVLNQFDASLALHLDVREVFRRQLGTRLLHRAIRRAPAVAEAQAEGMTVIDYAPNAAVVQDYFDIAAWLRRISPPAIEGLRARPRTGNGDDPTENPDSDGSGE